MIVCKCRIRQAVPKWKEGVDLTRIVMSIPDKDAFPVDALARLGRRDSKVVEGRIVFETFSETVPSVSVHNEGAGRTEK